MAGQDKQTDTANQNEIELFMNQNALVFNVIIIHGCMAGQQIWYRNDALKIRLFVKELIDRFLHTLQLFLISSHRLFDTGNDFLWCSINKVLVGQFFLTCFDVLL